ncbi:MAG: ribonuclease III [Gammaproteobacteria bacterium]
MSALARWAETRLAYSFEDQNLLQQALTHRSASRSNYERLEFLGDSFLNFTVAARLYERCPQYDEGELSRARASLVNRDSLADIAREVGLDRQIILGEGERRTGGAQRGSVLADALEAVIGGILLDGGHAAAREVILGLFDARISELPLPDELKDSKTRLQEWLQGRGRSLPVYSVESMSGKDHERVFNVRCELVDAERRSTGAGRSRRSAEQSAAAAMLRDLTNGAGQ